MIELLLFALAAGQQEPEPVRVLLGTHPYVVSSASMEPSLAEGDVIVANRARGDCGTTVPALGDVVIINRNDVPWIRRVVAGPGETVEMIDGVLTIDGTAVAREEVENPALSPSGLPIHGTPERRWRETRGARSYLTADFGPGDLDNTPPVTVPEGHWFLMGDSRDNSVDDRLDGPTPSERICGVVLRTLRSADTAKVGTRP